MGFLLKIYFLGLVAFIPSPEVGEFTAVLVNARSGFQTADGATVAPHVPLLLTRAAHCSGDCRTSDLGELAQDLYLKSDQVSQDRLLLALGNGGAWHLDSSDLLLVGDGLSGGVELAGSDDAPGATSADSYSWVAKMSRILPAAAEISSSVLALTPKHPSVAGRLTLAGGRIATARLVSLEDEVVPVTFAPLGAGGAVDYSGPMADWVVAEIPVTGCQVTVAERRFDGSATRSLTLEPESCEGDEVVEMVLVNLPRGAFREDSLPPPGDVRGRHFEAYFDLAAQPPPADQRPVPVLADAEGFAPPTSPVPDSTLLELLPIDRGELSRTLCPGVDYGG